MQSHSIIEAKWVHFDSFERSYVPSCYENYCKYGPFVRYGRDGNVGHRATLWYDSYHSLHCCDTKLPVSSSGFHAWWITTIQRMF